MKENSLKGERFGFDSTVRRFQSIMVDDLSSTQQSGQEGEIQGKEYMGLGEIYLCICVLTSSLSVCVCVGDRGREGSGWERRGRGERGT